MAGSDFLSKLPLEILLMILSQLPVPSLVAFGATSRANYAYHILCMRRLHLAIFQKRIHATIAFLDIDSPRAPSRGSPFEDDSDESGHRVAVVLPHRSRGRDVVGCKSPLRGGVRASRRNSCTTNTSDEAPPQPASQTIRVQNEIFAKIVSRYGGSLVDLEFMAYDLNSQGAIALGSSCGRKLRHLALRFEHPHIRDCMLGRNYWLHPPPGSTAWNALIGVGEMGKDIGLSNLESLVLERAGITPWQLRMLVKRNPKLRDLRLRTCAAVQPEFLNWLGGIDVDSDDEPSEKSDPAPGASLETLWVENCDGISSKVDFGNSEDGDEIRDTGLEWIRNLKGLKVGIPQEGTIQEQFLMGTFLCVVSFSPSLSQRQL